MPEDASKQGDSAKENVPLASRKDGRDAVVAARAAWDGWSARTGYNRGQILYRMGEMLEARRAELARSLERGGKSAKDAAIEAQAAVDRTIAYAGWTDKYQSLLSSLNPVSGPHFTFTLPESMGVVVIVAPRLPALLGLVSVILPILASGNTCVVLGERGRILAPRSRSARCWRRAICRAESSTSSRASVSEVLPHLAKHMEVAALDLHGLAADLVKSAHELAAGNVKRVHSRSLDEATWLDAGACETPRWIERFVELKTIWHPVGS